MSRIRSTDTKPEIALRKALWARGVRGWRCNRKSLPGKPDISFGPAKVAVFVDGRFWHGHPDFFTFGKSGEYWDKKIARTKERDREADSRLAELGWAVMRFWDFEVEEDAPKCAMMIQKEFESRRRRPETVNRESEHG